MKKTIDFYGNLENFKSPSKKIKDKNKLNQFNIFWLLVKTEFSDLSFIKFRGNIISKIVKSFLLFAFFAAAIFLFRFLLSIYATLGVKPYYALIPLIIIVYTIFTISQGLASLSTTLYMNPKNDILFSFPIKNYTIYLAKIFARYIIELMRSALFILPFFIALYLNYQIFFGDFGLYFLRITYITFLLPAYSIFIATIFATVYFTLKSLLKKSRIATSLLAILIIVGLFILVYFTVSSLITEIPNGKKFILFSTFEKKWFEYNVAFSKLFNNTFFFRYLYYMIFEVKFEDVNFTIIRHNAMLHVLITLAYTLIIGLIATIISYFIYFKLANLIKMSNSNKENKGNVFAKLDGSYKVFLFKEFKLLFRNSKTLSSYIYYIFLLPLISFTLNMVFANLNLTFMGARLIYFLNIFIGLLILTTSNTLAATIITREGLELPLLKTVPGNTYKLITAKLSINVFLNCLIVLLNMVVLIVLNPLKEQVPHASFYITIILLIYNLLHIIMAAGNDITKPEHIKFGETKDIASIKNVSNSVVMGIVMSLFVVVLMAMVSIERIRYSSGLIIVLGLLVLGFSIYRLYQKIRVYYVEIGG